MSVHANEVVVVTISEQFPCHGNKTDVVVFSSMIKAETWIEKQISMLAKRFKIPPESIDGWFVEFEDVCHTIQYDARKKEIR